MKLLLALGVMLMVLGGSLTALSNSRTSHGSPDASSPVSTPETTPSVDQRPDLPELEPTPTPEPAENRADCDEIRGQDYLSLEERIWFLTNCVGG